MPTYTAGSTRVPLQQPDLDTFLNNGTAVLDSRRTRPLWFDGRFMAARDLEREQGYFLQREADLGQATGFENLTGLMVLPGAGQGSVIIKAGNGYTPAGELVTIPWDITVKLSDIPAAQTVDVQFGISTAAAPSTANRTGLYVIALQPVEYTGGPISAYPTTVQGARTMHDGDIIAATAIALVPYPSPPATFPAGLEQAAVARQIFVTGSPAVLPDSLLPLAVVSLNSGRIQWLDPYMVRRDTGSPGGSVRFGLTDPATQNAYLQQYDAQLQSVVAARQAGNLKANITASKFFQALPPAGRFPLDAISTADFSQVFFPQEMDVRLSIVPDDEVPALFEDSLSLPPIDLTLTPDAYANIGVLALVPVPRDTFAALKSKLPGTPLVPILPQVLANRSPLQLLLLFQGSVRIPAVPPAANTAWASAIGSQKFGYYLRRRTQSTLVPFATPTGVTLVSSVNPSAVGQSVTFTATVSPKTATGTVIFLDGGAPLGTAPIANGVASLAVSTLTAGAHTITADYPGDGTHAADNSAPLAQVVKASVTVSLASSVNPSDLQQAVTFTATLAPNTATGTVQFRNGTTVLGSVAVAAGAAKFTTSTLTAGVHTLTAVYGGDDNDAPGTSAPLAQTVRAASTVALSSSLNPSTAGQPVTFAAKVTPPGATGSVQFRDGATAIGNGNISGGTAAFTSSTLTAGPHSISAVYAGDGSTEGSTSAPLTQNVRAASTVSLASSVNPSNAQQPVVFTAAVVPASASGSVTFQDGATVLGTSALSGGAATFSTSTLSPGTHPITATYGGDTADAPGISSALPQLVKALTTVTITSSVNPSNQQQAVVFTATVTPIGATGNVQFLEGAAVLGSGTLSGGVATATVAALAPGAHTVIASYAGDGNHAASASQPLVQTVRAPSSVALASSVNPSNLQQPVTFTATLTPKTGGGNIQFLDGANPLGSAALNAGAATLTVSTLAAGGHPITATYAGDNNTAASASTLLNQVVRAATKVALASSVNPANQQQPITFTATLSPATATGSIQFVDGTTSLGTGTIAAGVATLITGALLPGPHPITASYGGDGNNAPAVSAALTEIVRNPSTVAVTSSVNPSNPQQPVTFTAKVTPNSATGSIQFTDNGAASGTGTLTNGAASIATSTLAAGVHTIVATYAGDNNTAAGASPAFSQTVRAVSGVALASSVNPSDPGQAVVFTATLTPKTATGNVQFLDGAASLGTGALNAGVATLSVSTLTAGPHSITASYAGDGTNAAAVSTPLAQTVRTASGVGLASSRNPSTFQQPVTFTAALTPKTASGTVTFQDASATPAPVTIGTATLASGAASITVATLAAGQHAIIASYPGDSADTPGSSTPLMQVVRAVTGVTLVSSVNPSNLQQAVTLTATVNPKNATGSIAFLDGSASLGSVALSGGVASLTVSTLTAGPHTVTGGYNGDGANAPSVSPPVVQTVRANSAVALASSLHPSTVGQSVTFTASVTPKTATGSVQFVEGTNVLGAGTLSAGVATFTIATLTAGLHSITAAYPGDNNNAPANSPAFAQTVMASASIAVVSSVNPSNPQQAVTFTATVNPKNASGSVQFLDGSAALGTVALNGGVAGITSATLTAGTHSITVTYPGDASTTSATSPPLSQVVKAASSTLLTASPNPSNPQQVVSLKATIQPAAATGSVTFQDANPTAPAPTILGTLPVSGGSATLSTGALASGTHTITAAYGGDAKTAGSNSPPVSQVVRAATGVTLTASPNPANNGTVVTLTARLAVTGATGSIRFLDGATVIGTVNVNTDGSAVMTISTLAVATHSMTASYGGDATHAAGTSAAVPLVINPVLL